MRTSSSSASRGPRRPSLLRRFLVLVAVVALCTCKINRIEVPVDGQSSIPKATLVGGLLGSLAFGGFDKINLSTELANQGVTRDQVDAVALSVAAHVG